MKMVNKCGLCVNCDVYLEMWIMYIFCGLTLFHCVGCEMECFPEL